MNSTLTNLLIAFIIGLLIRTFIDLVYNKYFFNILTVFLIISAINYK